MFKILLFNWTEYIWRLWRTRLIKFQWNSAALQGDRERNFWNNLTQFLNTQYLFSFKFKTNLKKVCRTTHINIRTSLNIGSVVIL